MATCLRRVDQTDDIEQIHQARVSCRRLRQVLIFFEDCFEPEQIEEWKKTTKTLLRRLGQARDLDVHADFLRTFIDSLDKDSKKVLPGLNRLLLRIQQQRHRVQDQVLRAASKFQRKKILIQIHLQTEKFLFQTGHVQSAKQDALRQRVRERLELTCQQMKEKEKSLSDPTDSAGHHALRIAVKRFRYTLEIADDIYGGLLNLFIKTAKKLQTLLGGLHDCVVWQETLDMFIDDEKERIREFCGHTRPFTQLKPGIEHLRQDRIHLAGQLYQQVCDSVSDINGRDLWSQLFDIISNQPIRSLNE